MKNTRYILLAILLQFAFLGCAEKKEIASDPSGDTGVGAGTVPGEAPPVQDNNSLEPNDESWGTAVPLTINQDNFNEFSGENELPNLENQGEDSSSTRLYYKIAKDGDRYKATIRLYYRFERVIGSPSPNAGDLEVVHYSPKFESGTTATDIQFNKFHSKNGNNYWVAFVEEKVWNPGNPPYTLDQGTYSDFKNFEDDFGGPAPFGSLMIVLDSLTESGSAGKVYFKNFDYSGCYTSYGYYMWWACPDKPQPPANVNYKCWNIQAGPYQCRETGVLSMLPSPEPYYTELGEVEGIFLPQ